MSSRPRTALICHGDSPLNRDGIARWLASFTDLAGVIVIEETWRHTWARIRREFRRSGILGLLDVLAFRLYYSLRLARQDRRWLAGVLTRLASRYPEPQRLRILRTRDPNSRSAEAFLRSLAPDLVVARCKHLLRDRIFDVPRHGTFVLHPGICPEYRNAHGSFWALANRDLGKVGLTLLRIDSGVDTGPVYGYYSYDFDETRESHLVIMARVVLDNLDALRDRLLEIHAGSARPLETTGRPSAIWGQPTLTGYLRWKRGARQERYAGVVARVP